MSDSAHVPAAVRRAVFERARDTCEYCRLQQEYTAATFEVDHVLPRVAGGESVLGNCCLACPDCNAAKRSQISAVDPLSGRRVALFHPRKQHWNRHFRWSEGFEEVLGKTPIGRATVAALRMNRTRTVTIRRAACAIGPASAVVLIRRGIAAFRGLLRGSGITDSTRSTVWPIQ